MCPCTPGPQSYPSPTPQLLSTSELLLVVCSEPVCGLLLGHDHIASGSIGWSSVHLGGEGNGYYSELASIVPGGERERREERGGRGRERGVWKMREVERSSHFIVLHHYFCIVISAHVTPVYAYVCMHLCICIHITCMCMHLCLTCKCCRLLLLALIGRLQAMVPEGLTCY